MNQTQKNGQGSISHTTEFTEEEIDLREYLDVIVEARWLVLGITAAVFALGLLYTIAATPIYRSDALLQVEDARPTISGLDDISSALTGEAPAVTEIEIIRSRSIIGVAIDQLGLAISVSPKYIPLFGASSARNYKENKLANPVWGFSSYAWGGERISVQRLDVSRELKGEALSLVAGENGNYELFDPDGKSLVRGETGKLASVITEANQSIDIFVSDLYAREKTRFKLIRYSRARIVRDFQERLGIKEKGRMSGILEITLEGRDPELTAKVVNSIASTYLRQNAERKSVEAERTLQFLDKQLPDLKDTLNRAETSLNNYRASSGKIDLTLETQGILEKLTEFERGIQTLQLEKTKLTQRFTRDHPAIAGINKQLSDLEVEKKKLEAEIKRLPETEQESIRLTRDVKVANELYLILLNKAQELKVIKAGTVGNVRILDQAIIPDRPVKPRKILILILSLLGGGLLAILSAFIYRGLFHGLEDPNVIEKKFGIPVYVSILHSNIQARLERQLRRSGSECLPVLATEAREDMTIEALRSLRTSLQFALMDSENNVIAFGGPSPGIGKSFISVNFSHILGDAKKKVILIDADMRKGHLHRYYSLERENGLSEILSGTLPAENAIKKTSHENVSFISAGVVPPNPSELLTSDSFSNLIGELSKQYDLVIFDTPPLLAVTDAVIISRISGIFFLILESRKHHVGEIEHSLKRMEHNGVRTQGIIMNNVRSSSYKYGYGGYRYSYQYKY